MPVSPPDPASDSPIPNFPAAANPSGGGIIALMKTALVFSGPASVETELLIVAAADSQTSKGKDAKPEPTLLTSDAALQAAASAVLTSGEFKAGANETLLLHAPAGVTAKRLLLVGIGKQAKATPHAVRAAVGTAIRQAKPR